MQQKYFETEHKIPIFLRDTAPINFDIKVLIKKINKIDKSFLKPIKKLIFARQEYLGRKKVKEKNGILYISNEIYDIDRCYRNILYEVSKVYFHKNEKNITSEIKEDFLTKKVNFYYNVVEDPCRTPLIDFLCEERCEEFDRYVKKLEYKHLSAAAEKHFLTRAAIYSLQDYFSDCFIGFYTRKMTEVRKKHKNTFRVIKSSTQRR